MGVGKKKQLAKDHIQKTELTRDDELGSGTILGDKEVEASLIVECELTDNEVKLAIGRQVRLIDLKKDQVEVFISGRQIGEVTAISSATLRERFDLAHKKERSVGGVVVDISDFTNTFTVRIH